jgi:DNA polymerase
MAKKLTIDFETRSEADIKKSGAAAYAMHDSTEAICLALKFEGEEPVIWYSPKFRDGISIPTILDGEVKRMVDEADIIEAHNAQFEYFIWKYVMCRYGFEMFDARKLRCSAAKAASCGLPRDLANACLVAGVEQQKDKDGARLMMSLCKPRKAVKADKLRDPDWETRTYWRGDAEAFTRLGQYCLQDVRAEEALSEALPDLADSEQEVWYLDLQINDRGIGIDRDSIEKILEGVEKHTEKLTVEFQNLTGLNSPTQRGATLDYLNVLGAGMDGLTKGDVEKALGEVSDDHCKRVLEIRQSLSKTSTAKYKSFLEASGYDDRVRGCFMYYGAGTGRWAGRLIQPQNFPRGSFGGDDIDNAIELFKKGEIELIESFYGCMEAASTVLRSMIVPKQGHDFICADYSAIEGRVLAWIAGEEEALEVYRRGDDPYKVAASAIYHVPYTEVTKAQRQIGKVAELALGYNGGTGAFAAMASGYGVNVPDSEAKDIIKKWRESRPATVRLWSELERACLCAIYKPNTVYSYRRVSFIVKNKILCIKLPSGRILRYINPRVMPREKKWGEVKDTIVYDGVNSTTRKWDTLELYGGLLAENITQATARDVLVAGIQNAEKVGYKIVLHVHDEAMAEVDKNFGSVEEFERLLCTMPSWADGLPLKAEGWRGERYRK